MDRNQDIPVVFEHLLEFFDNASFLRSFFVTILCLNFGGAKLSRYLKVFDVQHIVRD